jgi:Zn-dependent peptidase ImmA (M78 family)
MSSNHELADFASASAEEIFKISRQCLMAHSTRAVEAYVSKRYNLGRYSIVIHIRDGYAAKAQSFAKGIIFPDTCSVFIDSSLSKESQRKAIAHELGHVILAFENRQKSGKLERALGRLAEDGCKIFEEELCARHHKFNKDDKNRHEVLFPSLAEHRLAE